MLTTVAYVLTSYLLGSISFAYLAGRICRSIDLRRYGSRKLSASNVYHQLGPGGLVAVGILDVSKAVLPSWLARRLGFALPVAVLAGLAAMLGHNWPVFLAFKGGRGISAALGTLLVVFPWGAAWLLGWVVLGRLVPRAAAVPALLGFITLVVLAMILAQPVAVTWGCIAMLGITVLKRLEANRLPLPAGANAWGVLVRRLVLDRDIANFDTWIAHKPQMDSPSLHKAG